MCLCGRSGATVRVGEGLRMGVGEGVTYLSEENIVFQHIQIYGEQSRLKCCTECVPILE